jgi:hypothetical protein
VKDVDPAVEPFEGAHLRIVARQDARWSEHIDERTRDRRQQPIHPLRQRLQHETVAIPIDDERGQQITFAVDEAPRGRVELQRFAKSNRVLQPRADERVISDHIARREHADRDLRAVAEEGRAERPPARSEHAYDVATVRLDLHDVRPIDPRMTAANPLFAARADNDGRRQER